MEQLDKITDRILEQAKVSNQLQTQPVSSSLQSIGESYNQEQKSLVAAQLGACLAVQRTYGKQASDIQVVAKIFLADLSDYPAEKVAGALEKWRKTSPEFPTPADIIAILDNKPKMSADVYRTMLKRFKDSGYNEFTEAGRYVKAYEAEFGS